MNSHSNCPKSSNFKRKHTDLSQSSAKKPKTDPLSLHQLLTQKDAEIQSLKSKLQAAYRSIAALSQKKAIKSTPRQHRIKTYWVCAFAVSFLRLSKSLVREICLYLCDPALIHIFTTCLERVHLEEFNETQRYLEREIEWNSTSRYTLIEGGRVFVHTPTHSANLTFAKNYIVHLAGNRLKVDDLPCLEENFVGLASQNCSIFAFGGRVFPKLTSDLARTYSRTVNTGRTLTVPSACSEWKFLNGTMNFAKDKLSVCEYKQKLYICGGIDISIDVFDLATNQFTASASVKYGNECRAVTIWEENLVMFQEDELLIIDVNTLESIGSQTLYWNVYGNNAAIGGVERYRHYLVWVGSSGLCVKAKIGKYSVDVNY